MRDIQALIRDWTSAEFDARTRAEIQSLVDKKNEKELNDRFRCDLEFGTGGMRGLLGAGTNRMNIYTVSWAAQGLATYVKANATRPGPLRAVIAYDCRHGSREFAEATAGVFAANGFVAHIFEALRPTPQLSFAVRRLAAHTGVVITASHNPKEYNGFKAYWDDGSQVVPPHDKGIIDEVTRVAKTGKFSRVGFEEGVARSQIQLLGREMDELYIEALRAQRLQPEGTEGGVHDFRIVFTPLHGTGGTLVPRALEDWGFERVFTEPEQMRPNGDFPTAKSPNPEEGAALERGIQLAKDLEAELVMATDPDADRVGIAVLHGGEYHLVTGNQLACLLADYMFSERKARGLMPEKPGMVSTIVTTPLLPTVAAQYGVVCPEVLTGFKWIAEKARQWENGQDGGYTFLYGCEESYGYLIGDHARDKDGIVACCTTAEMAAWHRAQGRSLIDAIHRLWARHGVHLDWQKSIYFKGAEGAERIKSIIRTLKDNPPKKIGPFTVERITRVDTGEIRDAQTGVVTGKINLPSSDVILFDLDQGARVVARPSGTEPKVKFYFFLRETGVESREKVPPAEIAQRLEALGRRKDEFQKAFLAIAGAE